MLSKVNQRNNNIINFKNLKYTEIPTPMSLMSDFLILLHAQCQPVLEPQQDKPNLFPPITLCGCLYI